MKFLIANNIPCAESVFAPHGQLDFFAGRTPSAEALATADVLLVRSITEVNQTLIAHAPQLKFVGTATIGTEHIDEQALRAQGIAFASCPGANAASVGEYVLTALLALMQKLEQPLLGRRAVIVGAGHTGQAAGQRLAALGLEVLYYDPPRAAREARFKSCAFDEVLQADVISLHVPLTRKGEHSEPTWHLFGTDELSKLQQRQILINASRGSVIDNAALLERLQQADAPRVILDVWHGEPAIDGELLQQVDLATPHIAGHSVQGKVNGTRMLYDACAVHFGWSNDGSNAPDWQACLPPVPALNWGCKSMPDQKTLSEWVLSAYPIWQDDTLMRQLGVGDESIAAGFDRLRRSYRTRFELKSYQVRYRAATGSTEPATDNVVGRLRALGFDCQ